MKKIKTIFICLILLSIIIFPSVLANNQTDLFNIAIAYYKMEEDNFNYVDEVKTQNYTFGTQPSKEDGILLKGQDFEEENSEWIWNNFTSNLEADSPFISFWVKPESLATTGTIISAFTEWNGNLRFGWWVQLKTDGKLRIFYTDGDSTRDYGDSTTVLVVDNWFHVCTYFEAYDDTDGHLFVNGGNDEYNELQEGTAGAVVYHEDIEFAIGDVFYQEAGVGWVGDYYDGMIDEVYYGNMNSSLNASDLCDFLYNGGSPSGAQQYPFVFDTTSPNISIIYPTNQSRLNNFNGTFYINCSDDTGCNDCGINDSSWNDNGLVGDYWNFNKAVVSEGNQSFNLWCNDVHLNNNSINYWFVTDTEYPTIILNSPYNNTIHNSNISLDIYYNDSYLWKTNTTITNSSNHVFYNNYSGLLGGATETYNISETFNILSMSQGKHKILMEATDTHTKSFFDEVLNELNSCNTLECVRYYNLKYANLYISFSNSLEMETIKDFDRFKFKFSKKDKSKLGKNKIILSSNEPLIYLEDSPYSCHFIINNKYWFDLEPLDCEVKKIKDNEYSLTFETDSEEIITESLGGLNEISKTTFFYVDTIIPFLNITSEIKTNETLNLSFSTSENVSVSWKFGIDCNGSTTGTKTLNDTFNIFQSGLINNTIYFYNITLNDTALNLRNYCLNLTTSQNPEVVETVEPNDFEDLNFSALMFISFLIYILLLYFAIRTEDYYIFYFALFLSVIISVWIFKYSNLPSLISVVFALFNAYLFIKLKYLSTISGDID